MLNNDFTVEITPKDVNMLACQAKIVHGKMSITIICINKI